MAQSQLALYNLALSLVGDDYSVAATNESSVPAATCELWYENTRQVMLRTAHWKCAKRHARLVVDETRDTAAAWISTDPEPGWAYSYTPPTGMLAARYMSDFSEFDVGFDDSEKVILSNVGGTTVPDNQPILCYTKDITDPTLWDADFYQALAFALGANIAIPLTGKSSRVGTLASLANSAVMQARANSANEMHRLFTQQSEELQLRGYAGPYVTTPYIYPYGSMFVPSGAPVI